MAQFKMDLTKLSGEWPDLCARCAKSETQLVPVPVKHTKNQAGWHVPLCKDHVRDWDLVQYRNRFGMLILLMAMLSVALLTWFLHPLVIANPGRDGRFVSTLLLGLLTALPVGFGLANWAKCAIRIVEVHGRLATIVGVHARFADAMQEFLLPPPLTELKPDQLFTSMRYRPKPECSRDALTLLFASTIFLSAILGAAAAFFAGSIDEATANWDLYSWRYIWLSLVAFAVIGLTIMRPWYFWLSRVGFAVCVFILVVALVLLIIMKWFGIPPKYAFALLYGFGPMIVLALRVLFPIITDGRIRHPTYAATCGFMGGLIYGCMALAIAHLSWNGQLLFVYVGAAISAVSLGYHCYQHANSPYCAACTNWLEKRRLAAFARSRVDLTILLDEGAILSFVEVDRYHKHASLNDCELNMYSCVKCQEDGTVVLELMECIPTGKHNTPTLKFVDRWEFPSMTTPLLNSIIPMDSDEENPPSPELTSDRAE